MNAEFQGKLELNNLCFTQCTFTRKKQLDNQFELNYEFKIVYTNCTENSQTVSVSVHVFDTEQRLDLLVVEEADAQVVNAEVLDKELCRGLLDVNSIALMVPYLRSQVVLMTAQPGIMPVQLPIVDATKLAECAIRE